MSFFTTNDEVEKMGMAQMVFERKEKIRIARNYIRKILLYSSIYTPNELI